MSIFKKALLTVMALGGGVISISAYADCTFASGFSADTQETISFGNLIVPPTTAVGTVVASITSTLIANRGYFITGCTSFNQQDWRSPGLPAVSYGGQVLYQSGVPGYAIRIVTPGAGSTTGQFGSGAFDRILTNVTCRASASFWDYCGGSWGAVTFQLVKITQTAETGQMSAGRLVRASIRGFNFVYTANLASSRIVNPGCTVINNNISVPMGDVPRSTFSGPGSWAAARNFEINLNCNVITRVSFKLDARADSSGVDGVIALNPAATSAASGVGIQVLFRANPLALGTTTLAGTNPDIGTYVIPFGARYYQTGPVITPGQANVTATFTITYN